MEGLEEAAHLMEMVKQAAEAVVTLEVRQEMTGAEIIGAMQEVVVHIGLEH